MSAIRLIQFATGFGGEQWRNMCEKSTLPTASTAPNLIIGRVNTGKNCPIVIPDLSEERAEVVREVRGLYDLDLGLVIACEGCHAPGAASQDDEVVLERQIKKFHMQFFERPARRKGRNRACPKGFFVAKDLQTLACTGINDKVEGEVVVVVNGKTRRRRKSDH